jgi:hypothetical protein
MGANSSTENGSKSRTCANISRTGAEPVRYVSDASPVVVLKYQVLFTTALLYTAVHIHQLINEFTMMNRT